MYRDAPVLVNIMPGRQLKQFFFFDAVDDDKFEDVDDFINTSIVILINSPSISLN